MVEVPEMDKAYHTRAVRIFLYIQQLMLVVISSEKKKKNIYIYIKVKKKTLTWSEISML